MLLYVEDNPANLKLVEQLIVRRPDMRLLTAVNGSVGIELARNLQPKVILMDINLVCWGCSISSITHPGRSISTKETFSWCIPTAFRMRKTSRKKRSERKDC